MSYYRKSCETGGTSKWKTVIEHYFYMEFIIIPTIQMSKD